MLNVSAPVGEAGQLLEANEGGFALPSRWYTDRALFEHERDAVLRRSWHYAADTDAPQ